MTNLKRIIEVLNSNLNVTKNAREWSDLVEPVVTISRYYNSPVKSKPASIYSLTQQTLKLLYHVGLVQVHVEVIGSKKKYTYTPITHIPYTELP